MTNPRSPSPVRQTRVVVIDDHPFFREGLVGWLNAQPGFACCGEAATIHEGLKVVEATKPHLVLLDLQLKDGDGLQLLAALTARAPATPVIVISRKDEDIYAPLAIGAGARGYVMKDEAPETLLSAIHSVLNGEIYAGPDAITKIAGRLSDPGGNAGNGLLALSRRELQVFELLGRGFSSKAIASELGVSIKTVDSYRESLKKKLHVPDGLTLIRKATLWHQE